VILVDTSVWIGHLRSHDDELARLIDANAVCTHPYVVGEIALGQIRQRGIVLRSLQALPEVTVATEREVLTFINNHALFGRGVGYVDASLLAATRITPHTWLWTRDKKLGAVAMGLGVAASPPFPAATLG